LSGTHVRGDLLGVRAGSSRLVHVSAATEVRKRNHPRFNCVGLRNPFTQERAVMGTSDSDKPITREKLAALLNEDLSREYQAIISYVVYSQVLKGAEYMNIADQLQQHAAEELKHALTISRQIDYLGAMPTVQAKAVRVSENAKDMLRFDLENEADTIRNYRERVRQCEAMGEFSVAEHIRDILLDEQDHLIDLATALGEDVPDLSKAAS
jgi:bacterioferritin